MIYVRLGKGGKDRGVPLPKTLAEKLNTQLGTVRRIHTADLAEGSARPGCRKGLPERWGPAPAIWVGSTFSRPRSAASIRVVASPLDTLRAGGMLSPSDTSNEP
jgi:hypothetical protein